MEPTEVCRISNSLLKIKDGDASEHPPVNQAPVRRILTRFDPNDGAIAILRKLLKVSPDEALLPALIRLDPEFELLRSASSNFARKNSREP